MDLDHAVPVRVGEGAGSAQRLSLPAALERLQVGQHPILDPLVAPADAGVVDEHRHRPEIASDLAEDLAHGRRVGHVAGVGSSVALAALADPPRRLLAQVDHRHPAPLAGKGNAHGLT
jgi:hypothetical protein